MEPGRDSSISLGVRAYLELAEGVHRGPMRAYVEEVRAYLTQIERLVGLDEHVCEVCGVRNVQPDGSGRVFFVLVGSRAFCEAHRGVASRVLQGRE